MANYLDKLGLKKVFTLLKTYLGGTYIPLSQKGKLNGVATLNADGKVPTAQSQFAMRGNLVAKDIDSTTLQMGFYRIIGQQLGDEILGGDAANGVLIQYSDGYKEQVLMVGRNAGAEAGEQIETYMRRYLPAASRWTEWSKDTNKDDMLIVRLYGMTTTNKRCSHTYEEIREAARNRKFIVALSDTYGYPAYILRNAGIDNGESITFSTVIYHSTEKYSFVSITSQNEVIYSTYSYSKNLTEEQVKKGTSKEYGKISPFVLKGAIVHHTSGLVDGGAYNSTTKKIELKHGNTVLVEIDATDFIKDGMVDSVKIENGNLVISFNTDSGKEDISLALTDIFNPDNYYTKQQTDDLLSGKANTEDFDGLQQQVEGKQDTIQDLDEIRAGANLGKTALQSETDPTVPEWAKQPSKPTYTAQEVGALPVDTPMFSGDYNDLNNKPTIPTVPTNVSAFYNDAGYLTEHQDLSGLVNGGTYNPTTKKIELKHGSIVLAEIDAAQFIVDGMVDDVRIENGSLVIDFNTESGKQDISIPLTDIFNPNNYYNIEQVDLKLRNKQDVIQDLDEIRSGAAAGATALQEHQKMKTLNEESLVGEGNINLTGNVQGDWNQTDPTADDYINNKPIVPFIVKVDDHDYADKTFAEISAALGSGRPCFLKPYLADYGIYALSYFEPGNAAVFTNLTEDGTIYIAVVEDDQQSQDVTVIFRTYDLAGIHSPNFTGIPKAPTAPEGTDTTQIATTAFVKAAVDKLYSEVNTLMDAIRSSIPRLFVIQYNGSVVDKTNQEINTAYYSRLNPILFYNSKIFTMKDHPGGGDARFISTDPTDNTLITVTTSDTVIVESY